MGSQKFNEDKKIKVSCHECEFHREEMAGVYCYNRYGQERERIYIRVRTNLDICPNIILRRPRYIAKCVKQDITKLKEKYKVKGEKG